MPFLDSSIPRWVKLSEELPSLISTSSFIDFATYAPTSRLFQPPRLLERWEYLDYVYWVFLFVFFAEFVLKSKVFLKAIICIEFKVFDDMKLEFWYPLSEEWTKGQKILEANVFISTKKWTKYFRSFFWRKWEHCM